VVHWLDSLLGVPSAAAVAALARPYASHEAFICGPDPYLSLVREALGQLRVPAGRVHVERFLSLAENPFEQAPVAPDDALAATLSVTLDGATTELPWPAGARMLDVLLPPGHLRRLRLPAHRRRGGDGAQRGARGRRPGGGLHPGLPGAGRDLRGEYYLLIMS
jgi:hypothetical protein